MLEFCTTRCSSQGCKYNNYSNGLSWSGASDCQKESFMFMQRLNLNIFPLLVVVLPPPALGRGTEQENYVLQQDLSLTRCRIHSSH